MYLRVTFAASCTSIRGCAEHKSECEPKELVPSENHTLVLKSGRGPAEKEKAGTRRGPVAFLQSISPKPRRWGSGRPKSKKEKPKPAADTPPPGADAAAAVRWG